MSKINYGWKRLASGVLLGFGLTIFFFQLDPEDGIVQRDALVQAEGKVAWTESLKNGVEFGLVGRSEEFKYLDKAGATGMVRRTLNEAGENIVSVWYDNKGRSPVYSDESRYDIWAIHVNGSPVRTYDEVASAWRYDNRMLSHAGFITLFISLMLCIAAWNAFRKGHG